MGLTMPDDEYHTRAALLVSWFELEMEDALEAVKKPEQVRDALKAVANDIRRRRENGRRGGRPAKIALDKKLIECLADFSGDSAILPDGTEIPETPIRVSIRELADKMVREQHPELKGAERREMVAKTKKAIRNCLADLRRRPPVYEFDLAPES
jgi:hypothetical protein